MSLADIEGPGSINPHLVALSRRDAKDADYLRRLVLKITWDDQVRPSVLVPLGGFFGMGHARAANFVSVPLRMSPQDGKGFDSWFHMPFASRAKVELISELSADQGLFDYYIDDLGRFHAQRRCERPTDGIDQGGQSNREFQVEGVNDTGEGNYVLLEAEGCGHCVFDM
ncbi:DUF2961 domain-containing protein [Nonomuraea sp. NPDC050404]|uniref:DUF2961 domain-containing protein n=1 Tax=Nonomuraea sp. NPDC050404 TaxID=3155783 RepID=UPI0033EBA863